MIWAVKGILADYTEEGVVVETAGGLELAVAVPGRTLGTLGAVGDEVRLFTHFQVAEDAMKLYGFDSASERDLFRLLLKVSGIGPKLAMAVLSAMTAEELQLAVVNGDVKSLSRCPGLGKKTAEKLILELKDKFSAALVSAPAAERAGGATVVTDAFSEAVEALTALGYSSSEALRTVRSIEGGEQMSVEEVLQAAFQKLAMF